MNEFLAYPGDRRRLLCDQAQYRLGLPPAAIEKDFWVYWTLQRLFALPEWGARFTFKGGTSLSKGWGLIDRFSEDIDIVIHRAALGFGDDRAPERAPSRKQTRRRLEELSQSATRCVMETIRPLLGEDITRMVPSEMRWELAQNPDDPDAQTLLLAYPAAFDPHRAYIRPLVKIEFGARSDTDPSETIQVAPLLVAAFPDFFQEPRFPVEAVSPRRTFWEKAMLLHEETFRPSTSHRKARMARHYYDLYRLIRAGIGLEAAADLALFDRIAAHRQVYFRYTWVDYGTLCPGRLTLVPPAEQLALWRADYAAMGEEMFFTQPPGFDELIETIREFQEQLHAAQSR